MEINGEAFLLKVDVVLVALLHEATGVAKVSMDQNRVWGNLHHQVGVSSIIVCYRVLGGEKGMSIPTKPSQQISSLCHRTVKGF
jgi:hypothetical protein